MRLCVVASHPIQYQTPLYQELSKRIGLIVLFAHKETREDQFLSGFEEKFKWDIPLLEGYEYVFLNNIAQEPSVLNFSGCDVPDLEQQIKRTNSDAVMVSGWNLKVYWQAMRACKKLKIPIFVRGDSVLDKSIPMVKKFLKALYTPIILKNFDLFLAVGKRHKEYLNHYGVPDSKIYPSPHCVDNQYFLKGSQISDAEKFALRKKIGLDENIKTLLFVGKFIAIKRPFDLIHALKKIQDKGKKIQALFLGNGPLFGETKSLAKELNVKAFFAGFKNQSEIPAHYALADLLILPSVQETWGLVVNEAMACGIPCIVSDAVGCYPDLIEPGKTGDVYSAGSADSLANAIEQFIPKLGKQEVKEALSQKIQEYSISEAAKGICKAVAGSTYMKESVATKNPEEMKKFKGRLVLVGNSGEVHIGAHLNNGAARLVEHTSFIDTQKAEMGPWILRKGLWFYDRRPVRLEEMSQKVLKECQAIKPKWLLTTGLAPVHAKTLRRIGELKILRMNYLTDDPFRVANKNKWFLKALSEYDYVFSPRKSNMAELKSAGVRNVIFLPFGYAPEIHFQDNDNSENVSNFKSDVVFIGGADQDRVPYIKELEAAGLDVHLYGGFWERYGFGHLAHGNAGPKRFRLAIQNTKVALCLVRKSNRDGNSMRTFEVPAVGACLLMEDTEDHRALFGEEGVCAYYFSTKEEMLEKCKYLLSNEDVRKRMAISARERILSGKNSYHDRLQEMLSLSNEASFEE